MMTQLAHIRWGRLMLAALAVYGVSLIIIFGVIFVYAFALGFQARGAPDLDQIQSFANQVGPLGGRIGTALLTLVVAVWLGRRVRPMAPVHGLLLGLIVGLIPLVFNLTPASVGGAALTIGLGWLGGVLGNLQRS